MAQSSRFNSGILYLIIINAGLLTLDSPLADPSSSLAQTLRWLDNVMVVAFTIEMMIKVISDGFLCSGPGSYLRDPWNVLDFSIVAVALFGSVAEMIDMLSPEQESMLAV